MHVDVALLLEVAAPAGDTAAAGECSRRQLRAIARGSTVTKCRPSTVAVGGARGADVGGAAKPLAGRAPGS
jgi:hypothetical protein